MRMRRRLFYLMEKVLRVRIETEMQQLLRVIYIMTQ